MEHELLRQKIKEKYGSVYRFAPKVGYTQSTLSKMLHGKRKIYPYAREFMGGLLKIPKEEYNLYFGEDV